jgi:poly(hydroxyalkanoate) granule-associated protein
MAGKKKIEKEGSSWVGGIEKYSRQIWLAGLGAYSKISNDGSKLFETLVKDGETAEKQAKSEVDKQVDSVKSSASTAKSRVGDVKDRALGKWGELEEAFDKRLNSAISRLGVPSRNEVKALHSKVDTLTKQIEKLTGASVKSVTTAKPAAAKPAPKVAATKPATKAKAAVKPVAAKAASAAKPAAKAASKAVAEAKPAVKSAAAKPAAAAKTAAKTATKVATAAKPAAAKKPAARKPAAPKAAAKPTAPAPAATTPAPSAPTPAAAPAPVPASQS